MPKILVFITLTLLLCGCGRGSGEVSPVLASLLSDADTANPYDRHVDNAPDEGCVRMRVRNIGPIGRAFNDSNHVHLRYAQAYGIEPLKDYATAWHEGRDLIEIKSNANYFVDNLTHSYPYLRPHAAELLMEIGCRFRDSLEARGGGAYRPKVTSVLRTPLTVGKLRRVNRNASGESAHNYATTFDISHSKFICDDLSGTHRTFEDLKNLLAEIVYDLRAEGRCVVKHERKQACFHITAIDKDSISTRSGI